MRVIKKYSNRRMYNTQDSKSITLPEIATLIMKGDDIQVVDNESGEDLTAITLAQIILEQEKDKGNLASVPILLRELIKKGRSTVLEFIERSLLTTVETVSLTREKARRIIQELIDKKKISQDEGEKLLRRLLSKAEESKRVLEEKIELGIHKAVAKLVTQTRKEINKLSREVQKLHRKIENLLPISKVSKG